MTLLVGQSTPTSGGSGNTLNPGAVYFHKFTASASGNASSLNLYVNNKYLSTTLYLGLYSSAGARLAQNSIPIVTGLNTVSISSTAISSGTSYYLALQADAYLALADDGTTNNINSNTHTFGALPSTLTLPGSTYNTGIPTIWADGTVGTGVLVGNNTPTSGGSGNTLNPGAVYFHKFTASASGNASSLNLYVNNKYLSTTLYLGLYSSAGARLAQNSIPIVTGLNTVSISSTAISSGTSYYLALQADAYLALADDGTTNNINSNTHTFGALPSTLTLPGSTYNTGIPTIWAQGSTGGIANGGSFTLSGAGFGTKSRALAPLVFDTGADAPIGSTSVQWTATGTKMPVAAGGQYNIQNQPPGFSPTGALIGASSPFVTAIIAGCHLTYGSNDSNSVMLGCAFTAPNVSGTVTYPFCMRYEYYYRFDPNTFNDPTTAANRKELEYGDTQTVYGAGLYCYSELVPTQQFAITHITNAVNAVATFNVQQASAPFGVGDMIAFFGIEGMTQLNGISGTVTAVSGGYGAWLVTTNINTSTMSAYGTALAISGITNASTGVVTLSSNSPTHPCANRDWVTFGGVQGMTGINNQMATASSLGGVRGAWTLQLIEGWYSGVGFDTTHLGTFTATGTPLMYSGGASVPLNNAMVTRSYALNPITQIQGPPDAAGNGGSSAEYPGLAKVLMPYNPTNGWIRRRVELCWSNFTGSPGNTGPGYFRVYDNGVLIFDIVGRTDAVTPSTLFRHAAMGSVYNNDRGPNNFCYFDSGFYDVSAGNVSGQCACVYVGDNPVYSSCVVLEPQIADTWTDGSIHIPSFNQGRLAQGAIVYPFVCAETGAKGTAIVPTNSSFVVGATSLPSVTTSTLPAGHVGVAYSAVVAVSGGVGAIKYSLPTVLPNTGNWLSINAVTGALTGTPGTAESEAVFVSVQDSLGHTAYRELSLTVST